MPRRKSKRPHGSGSYVRRGARHVIYWTDLDGKRRSKSYPDDISAKKMLSQITAEVAQGREGTALLQRPDQGGLTLGERAVPWLEGRVLHASHYSDVKRWKNHWEPMVGNLLPDQLSVSLLKSCLVKLRAKGLSNTTVRLCVLLVSSFYGDLVEEGFAKLNPVRLLSKKTRREYLKPAHDPKDVPFIRDPLDIVRVYSHIMNNSPSVGVAFAVGALAGLRTAEVRALDFQEVDWASRKITVRRQVECRTGRPVELLSDDGTSGVKDDEVRIVPLFDALFPILLEQKNRTGGIGLVHPPRGTGKRIRTGQQFLDDHTMSKYLRLALTELGLEQMTWYQATRHTFASQWVLHGGTLEKLQEFMGHSSIVVTERYAHLIPGRFTDEDRTRIKIEMRPVSPTERDVLVVPVPNERAN